MIRSLAILLTFFLPLITVHSQSKVDNKEAYKDFVLDGKTVWLLTTSGVLKVANIDSRKAVGSTVKTDAPVVAITKDRNGIITIGDTAHQIRQYDKQTKLWHNLFSYSGKLMNLFFNNQNHCFLLTREGLTDPVSGTTYFPDSTFSSNESYWLRRKRWQATPTYFMDRNDILWLGLDYGEWGGDIFAFDTKARSFVRLQTDSLRMRLNPVFGFCEDDQHTYMSGGLSHMGLVRGSIAKFSDRVASNVLVSENREMPVKVTLPKGPDGKKKTETWISWKGGHQIGPIAYNPANKCLYFYSQFGIYKSVPATHLSDIKQWKNVLKPNLPWSGGQQYSVGPAMNVLKMLFASDGTLLFLTDYEGLGIYLNKASRFIK